MIAVPTTIVAFLMMMMMMMMLLLMMMETVHGNPLEVVINPEEGSSTEIAETQTTTDLTRFSTNRGVYDIYKDSAASVQPLTSGTPEYLVGCYYYPCKFGGGG